MLQRPRKNVRKASASSGSMRVPNFVGLVDKYKKAVVGIEVVQEQSSSTRMFPIGLPWDRSQNHRAVNIGTGFIFNRKGHILTNEHVVHGASQVLIRVYGKKNPIKARVIESDYKHDIAILEADISIPNTILKVGRSSDVKVGEWVVAIGSPLGLDHTVTVGIVSATERPLQIGDREYPNLLQTDAAINRGNSGGPLIRLNGDVIGMNTAVSQSSQGIGFAISADVLKDVVSRLMR